MRSILLLAALATLSFHANAQWNQVTGPPAYMYYTLGNVGIGINNPSQKLDVRDGTIQMIPNASVYSFIARSAAPGNESYFYHLMSPSYHILGSSKNGTGTIRKLGFAVGT